MNWNLTNKFYKTLQNSWHVCITQPSFPTSNDLKWRWLSEWCKISISLIDISLLGWRKRRRKLPWIDIDLLHQWPKDHPQLNWETWTNTKSNKRGWGRKLTPSCQPCHPVLQSPMNLEHPNHLIISLSFWTKMSGDTQPLASFPPCSCALAKSPCPLPNPPRWRCDRWC